MAASFVWGERGAPVTDGADIRSCIVTLRVHRPIACSACAQLRVNPQAGAATPLAGRCGGRAHLRSAHANRTARRATASTARRRPGCRFADSDPEDSSLPGRRPMRTRTRCCRGGFPTLPGAAGWVARLRADPGRAGAIALAVVAALAVLVTIFTLVRDRPAPVMSAKLPPVERASTASPRSSASPAAGSRQVRPAGGGQRGRPGAHARAGHPGARRADRRCAAGRRRCGGRCGHHRIEHGPSARRR